MFTQTFVKDWTEHSLKMFLEIISISFVDTGKFNELSIKNKILTNRAILSSINQKIIEIQNHCDVESSFLTKIISLLIKSNKELRTCE